jgi:peptidoglycan/LPS O-acetylase OafA/YrhL
MRLQRVTTSGRWIPEVDGLRFVAIACVVLAHVANPLYQDPRFHWVITEPAHVGFVHVLYQLGRGVPLFFVISGFILAQPFVRQHLDHGKPVSLGAFYLRRVTRLEPPYILSLLIYALALWVIRSAKHKMILASLLASLFYVHNFFPSPDAVNPATWSLEVEIQFYVIAPLMALLFLIRSARLRRSVIAGLALLFSLLPHATLDQAGFYLPSFLCYFLAGYLLADLRVTESTAAPNAVWDAAGLVLWSLFFFLPAGTPTPVLCLAVFLCFVSATRGPLLRRLLRIRWISLLGGMCYSIYLLHTLVIHGIYPLTRHALIFSGFYRDYLLSLLLAIGPVLLVSVAYFVVIERPCMNPHWPRHLKNAVANRFRQPKTNTVTSA